MSWLATIRSSCACALLCLVGWTSSTAVGIKYPVGTATEGVQFDTVITLESSQGRFLVNLFTRYWVSPEYYHVAVIWVEPHGRGLTFPIYPPSLTVASSDGEFSMLHDVFPAKRGTWPKPLQKRKTFDAMFGDYPIDNMRFAEEEALATRLYARDLAALGKTHSSVRDISLTEHDGQAKRDIASLKMRVTNERIESLELFGKDHRAIKVVRYDYTPDTNGAQLRQMRVRLNERTIAAGLPGEGVRVTLGGVTNQFKELAATHHKGGRLCTVDYELVALGEKIVSLPHRVEVRGPDGRVLRTAQMTNFRQIALTPDQVKEAAARYGGFTPEHREYRELLVKYWEKAPADISTEDRKAIRGLLNHFEEVEPGDKTTGEQLRRLNVLMELNRMLGNTEALERKFVLYLNTLCDAGLSDMLLTGGYCAIDTLMLWGRTDEANTLLDRWTEMVSQTDNLEPVRRFAARELPKGNFWATARLLEEVSERANTSSDLCFEIETTRCLALRGAQELLEKRDQLKTRVAKAQADWITSSVDLDQLRGLVEISAVEAQQKFNDIQNPTKQQESLKERIDSLAQTKSME